MTGRPTRASTPAPSPSLQEHVYGRLRQDITDGRLRPGQRLTELGLAEQFGVSQGPVREALRRLDQEGLVVTEPRRGVHVRQLTLEEIDDIFQVRAELEGAAARRYPEHRTPGDDKLLQRALVNLQKAGSARSPGKLLERDLELHAVVMRAAGSPLLLTLWQSVTTQWRGMRTIVASQNKHDSASVVASHEPIVAALLLGDGTTAERLAREHALTASRELRDLLMAAPPDERLFRT